MNALNPTESVAVVAPARSISWRLSVYLGLAVALSLLAILLGQVHWLSNDELHSHFEIVATLLAFAAGILALARYYSRRQAHILVLGAGLIGTAVFDSYHAFITADFMQLFATSLPEALIPWSWASSRVFLGVILCLTVYGRQPLPHSLNEARRQEISVYLVIAVLVAANFAFFSFAALPDGHNPFGPFTRPQELIPGLLYALALIRFLQLGQWRYDPLHHWLVVALIIASMSQVLFMSRSGQLHDALFDAAHVLKILSYLCILIGLVTNAYQMFRRLDEMSTTLRHNLDALHREIQERRRAEDRSKQFGDILDNSFNEIFLFRADNLRFVQVNRGARDNLGYSNEEVLALTPVDIKPDYTETAFREFLAPLLRGDVQQLLFDTRHRRRDGSHYPVEVRLELSHCGDSPTFVAIIQDISERLATQRELASRAEELARSNAELEQFAYVASHDLQEPLRMVSSYTQLLARRYHDRLDDDARTFIEFAADGANRMQALVNDLLDFSRVGTRAQALAPLDSRAAVDWALHNLRHQMQERAVTIDIQPLPWVLGDATQLGRVFQNLIGNAIKFCPNHPPKVRIAVTRQGEYWEFSVADNGIGIDPRYFDRVFVIFQRLHNRDEYSGTGIGLAITRKIIHQHGGKIWLSADHHPGARFHFTLRAMPEEPTA